MGRHTNRKTQRKGGEMNYNQCEFCNFSMFIDQWGERKILGCKHEPYKGKWTAEIKECPKKGEK